MKWLGGEAFPDAYDDECMSEISVEINWSEEEEEDISRDPDWAELEEIVSESGDDSEDTRMRDGQQTKNFLP